MEEVHYFIFIMNADSAVFATVIFAIAFVALRLVYRMWRASLRCPHCGETYKHRVPPPQTPSVDRNLPQSLWT